VPAGSVHAGVHRPGVVGVAGGGSLVVIDLPQPTDPDGGVHPDQVLTVAAVVAKPLQFGAHLVEAGLTGRGHQHLGDLELAGAVGDPAQVAAAAGLAGAQPHRLVDLGRPLAKCRQEAGVAVRDGRGTGIDDLDAVAGGAVADTGHRRRAGRARLLHLLQCGQPTQPRAGTMQAGPSAQFLQGGAVEQADPGRWGVVAVQAGDQRTTAQILADHGRIRCLLLGQQLPGRRWAGGGHEGHGHDCGERGCGHDPPQASSATRHQPPHITSRSPGPCRCRWHWTVAALRDPLVGSAGSAGR
jgi:hypothetical protein